MTNEQLYLLIGVPAAMYIVATAVLVALLKYKFDALFRRFEDMSDHWQSELRRAKEVLDASR